MVPFSFSNGIKGLNFMSFFCMAVWKPFNVRKHAFLYFFKSVYLTLIPLKSMVYFILKIEMK